MRHLPRFFENNRAWAARSRQEDPAFFERLSRGQAPDYLWIGCADSRVPPSRVVGVAPGEVFVHRNIANLVHESDLNALSVIQFAVDVLHVEHVIVCGHYGCGGVQAALGPRVPPPLERWIMPIRGVARVHRDELDRLADPEARWRRLCELSVEAQVRALQGLETVRAAWDRGQRLVLHGWIFDLAEGLLHDLDVTTEG
jgi:carbonic anhydrase